MKIIDLSHTLYDGLKTHASHPRVIINDFVTHSFSAPRYLPPCKGFATKQLLISDHAGTHVDAPLHFYAEGETIESQPLAQYFGPAVLLDVSDKEPQQPVDREVVQLALARDGLAIEKGDIVLIRAWSGEWGSEAFHAAGALEISAARWLVEQGMKAVGIDLGNIETNSDMSRQVHLFLLGRKIPIYENIAHLERLQVKRFLFAGFPLCIQGASGSPVRAVAMVEEHP